MEVVALVIAVLALVLALLALLIVGWLYARMYPYVAALPAEDTLGYELEGSRKPAPVHEVLTEGATQPPGKA
ncbi:MAG TPA: hypothetical protein VF815_44610 [Myxococcaceae bacterium]|jgi:hypothetical protein